MTDALRALLALAVPFVASWLGVLNFVVAVLILAVVVAAVLRQRAHDDRTLAPPSVVPGVTEWRVTVGGVVGPSGGDLDSVGFKPGQATGRPISDFYAPDSDTAERYRAAMEDRASQDWIERTTLSDGRPYVGRVVILPHPDGGLWCRATDLTDLVLPYMERATSAERDVRRLTAEKAAEAARAQRAEAVLHGSYAAAPAPTPPASDGL